MTPYTVTYRVRGDGQRTTQVYAASASNARTAIYMYLKQPPSAVDILSIHADA